MSGETSVTVMLSACLGAAVALGVSGVTSAYISEAAERRKELRDLELAMATDLAESAHGFAVRLVPAMIAVVTGLSPLVISLLIIAPLWLPGLGLDLPWQVLDAAIGVAFFLIFLLGIFLGRIGGGFWLWSGLKTVLVAGITVTIILLLEA